MMYRPLYSLHVNILHVLEHVRRPRIVLNRPSTGVICDKKVTVQLKNKLYKTVIIPTLICGSECWALHLAGLQRMHAYNRDENAKLDSGQNKEKPNRK